MCDKVEKYGDEREQNGRIEGRLEGRIEGRLEGKLEGQVEGENKARIENAKRMIADKIPLDKVSAYSGLSLSEVEKLAN